ncbi:hypothetical protein [Methylococcus mesophilus]|uniref:hypothetical protein n=1 Tax=Methylococcus mesophilus TaxID=2993564 RepID=UPI00224A6F23|nr:hypothetical protein [Methylococcus mesophilus]UZR30792.1 hypothetical protein OOT43_09235 [Methylococcus mesophilus]
MAELDTTNPKGLRQERTIEAGGRKVVVRELTVGEVRAWLKDANAELDRNDLVALALFADITLDDLTRFSDLSRAELDAMLPSELDKVREAAKSLNPHFFGLRERLANAAQAAATAPPAT